MRSTDGAKVLPFPGHVHQEEAQSPRPAGPVDEGCLALDSLPFVIDEPDPLVVDEGRCADLVSPPDRSAGMRMIQGGGAEAPAPGARKLRLKDLHPMDCVIILGFLVIAALL